jgi:hypothetical protein
MNINYQYRSFSLHVIKTQQMLRLHHYLKLEAIENKHHESTTMGDLSVEAPSVSAVTRSITEEAAM